MPSTRTIWRAAFRFGAVSLVWAGFCPACESHGKPKRLAPLSADSSKRLAPDARTLEGRVVSAGGGMPSVVAQTLEALHEQRLDVPPPSAAPQRLAFGPERLLQASVDHVVLRETKQGDPLTEVNIGAVLALAHGSDGALFALGASEGTRFEARAEKARGFPHATFFPDSVLFPDLEQPSYFYVYHSGVQELLRYSFETEAGAFLPIEARIPLEGCTSAPTQLRDGALACRTAAGFARKAPRGPRTDFTPAGQLGQPFRLLPGYRLDELYAIDRAGQVEHVRLVAGVPVLGVFRLPALPYAAAANGEALAFILVSAPEAGKERRWSLLVTDLEGAARLRVELSAQSAPADEDWAKTIAEDKNLAISRFEPLVAVGGAERVTVWDYHAGKARFSR